MFPLVLLQGLGFRLWGYENRLGVTRFPTKDCSCKGEHPNPSLFNFMEYKVAGLLGSRQNFLEVVYAEPKNRRHEALQSECANGNGSRTLKP